jgi:hypothetical protein
MSQRAAERKSGNATYPVTPLEHPNKIGCASPLVNISLISSFRRAMLKTIYRTAHISFRGWRDDQTEMFAKGGGLNV